MSPEKISLIVENAWEQKCLQAWKNALETKNTPGYIQYYDA